MPKSKLISYWPLALVLIGFLSLSFLLYHATPAAFVAYIGIQNGYLLMGLVSFLSGVSLFTGTPYILLMVTLVAGGLHPLLLAAVATVGDALGSLVAYFLGRLGRELAPAGVIRKVQDFMFDLSRRHPRLVPLAIFLYGCMAPFSNDAVTIPLGLAKYPLWAVMLPLQAGTFIYNLTVAFGGLYLYTYFFG